LAYNYKCYDAWYDVWRLENFIGCENIDKGFAIWLTNIESLTKDWDKVKKSLRKIQIKNQIIIIFFISNNRKIPDDDYRLDPKEGCVKLEWDKASSKEMNGRKNGICIKGSYEISWDEYKDLSNEKKILTIKVPIRKTQTRNLNMPY